MYMIYRISGLFFACHTICDLKKILIATTTGCRFRVLYRCDNKKDFKNIITKVTGYTIYYLAFFRPWHGVTLEMPLLFKCRVCSAFE